MSDTPAFAAARDQQHAFKSAEIRAYAVAFIRAALRLLDNGINYAGSDDVDMDTDGTGIAGSTITMLRNAHVIADYFYSVPSAGIYGGRRKSKRASANGRKISLYTLTNRGMAKAWLRANGEGVETKQMELAI